MITRFQAERVLGEFEQEVGRVGYETADKRALTNLFGYLKLRCADNTIYSSTAKLKAVQALEQRWQRDRIGQPIILDRGEVMGYDPNGTQRGALTIGAIIRELRALLVELPENILKPAPMVVPAMLAPGLSSATIDAAIAKALAARDAQQKASASV
jgi:hypothetical protein